MATVKKHQRMVKLVYVNKGDQNETAKENNNSTPITTSEASTDIFNRQPWMKPRTSVQVQKLRTALLPTIRVDEYGISYTFHKPIFDWKSFLINEVKKKNARLAKRIPTRKKLVTEQDFELLHTIGKGAFGTVKVARMKIINVYLAAKIISKEKNANVPHVLLFKREMEILRGIFFPFAIHLEFYFKTPTTYFLILPLLLGGDLFSFLIRQKSMNEKMAAFCAAQIVLTLEYLHNLDIVYRDLKPENILIDHRGYLKLTDFGLSKFVTTRTYTMTGTPEYIAPEIIENRGYAKSVDWWSLGVLIYELCSGHSPFANIDNTQVFSRITKGDFTTPSHFTSDLCDLIKNLLVADVSRRYGNMSNGVEDIKSHRWFHFINWLSLVNCQLIPPFRPQLKSQCDIRYLKDNTDQHLTYSYFANF